MRAWMSRRSCTTPVRSRRARQWSRRSGSLGRTCRPNPSPLARQRLLDVPTRARRRARACPGAALGSDPRTDAPDQPSAVRREQDLAGSCSQDRGRDPCLVSPSQLQATAPPARRRCQSRVVLGMLLGGACWVGRASQQLPQASARHRQGRTADRRRGWPSRSLTRPIGFPSRGCFWYRFGSCARDKSPGVFVVVAAVHMPINLEWLDPVTAASYAFQKSRTITPSPSTCGPNTSTSRPSRPASNDRVTPGLTRTASSGVRSTSSSSSLTRPEPAKTT